MDVRQLPPPARGTAMMTLNLANGASDKYRTEENRAKQAELIRRSGAAVVAFQEVDTGAARTGDVHTALDVLSRFEPSFGVFARGDVAAVSLDGPANATAIRRGTDGTTVFQTPKGALIAGESFSGDDRGRGIHGDVGADATYGNALYVAAPNRVLTAYTVMLPHHDTSSRPPVASVNELRELARGRVSAEERASLGEKNEAVRRSAAKEPRSALVVRIVDAEGREKSLINVHAAAGIDNKALRDRQLRYLAELALAELAAAPDRQVAVLGDFNATVAEVGEALEPAGLRRVVGGRAAGIANLDQIWVSANSRTHTSAQVRTSGVSDHPHAGYTVVE